MAPNATIGRVTMTYMSVVFVRVVLISVLCHIFKLLPQDRKW